jgi:MinD superfamily P-loop ATPase containing an inserted ferredoxin domain
MRNTIFYVGGGKGGVGKSMLSLTLVQFLIDKYGDSKTIHLIETDESNPDVGRVYRGKIPVTAALLDEEEKGWILVADTIEKNDDTLFVINSAARSMMGIRKNGGNFSAVLESGKLPYDLVTFWPMNRQKDSVLLLEDYLRYVKAGAVYPVRNQYFGGADDFALYVKHLEESELLAGRITGELDFPALADVIADDFYTRGKTIPETVESLGAFAGQSFLSWRNQVYKMYEKTGLFSGVPDSDYYDDLENMGGDE